MNGFNDTAEIRELLERYFEGEISSQEENVLRRYFISNEAIPPDMEYARAMFAYFGYAAKGKPGKVFETPVNPAQPQSEPQSEQMQTIISPVKRRSAIRLSRNMWRWIGSAAAAAIIAVAIPLTMPDNKNNGDTVYCYINGEPITNYDLAYAYTQGALGLIEDNLRKPGECLASVSDAENHLSGLQHLGLFWSAPENECE